MAESEVRHAKLAPVVAWANLQLPEGPLPTRNLAERWGLRPPEDPGEAGHPPLSQHLEPRPGIAQNPGAAEITEVHAGVLQTGD